MNKKHNINIRLDEKLLEKIDAYQIEYFFSSRSEAIRHLAALGVEYTELARDKVKQTKSKEDK